MTTHRSMRPDALQALRAAVTARTGIGRFGEADSRLIRAAARRSADLGCDVTEYPWRVVGESADSREFARLVDEITVGETWFFRHVEQLNCLFNDFVRARFSGRATCPTLAIWSAGCAGGAEPYSLAMRLDQAHGAAFRSGRVSIIATDISEQCLERARAGEFTDQEIRSLPASFRARYFARRHDRWCIDDALKKRVEFRRHNLVSDAPPTAGAGAGRFDVVLCRNVLIYFSAEGVRRAADCLARSLSADGVLVTGSSDPFHALAGNFQLAGPPASFVYRKRSDRRVGRQPAMPLLPEVTPPPQLPVATSPEPSRCRGPADRLEELARLLDRGRWQEATAAMETLRADPAAASTPRYHMLGGLLAEHHGDPRGALACFKAAVYLDAGNALAEFHLGRVALQLDDDELAARSFRNSLRLCRAALPGAQDAEVTPDRLADMAATQLQRLEAP